VGISWACGRLTTSKEGHYSVQLVFNDGYVSGTNVKRACYFKALFTGYAPGLAEVKIILFCTI
jgi:hypothetical protein